MKKHYCTPQLEMVRMIENDVLTASPLNNNGQNQEPGWGPMIIV